MAFDGEVRAVEGGTHAHVRSRAIDAAVEQGFRGVDSVGGQAFLLGGEIERGENETAAGARAGADFSGEGKGPPEKSGGLRDVAGTERVTNSRA